MRAEARAGSPTRSLPRSWAELPAAARPALVSGLVAAVLAVLFLLAPPLGTDLSAQQARADFFAAAGFTPVDLRWYGGTVQYGYSLVTPLVMAALGTRFTGALAAVVSTDRKSVV